MIHCSSKFSNGMFCFTSFALKSLEDESFLRTDIKSAQSSLKYLLDTTKVSRSNHPEVLYKIIGFLKYVPGTLLLNVSKVSLLSTFDKPETLIVATWVEIRISHRESCSDKFRKTQKNCNA